MVLVIAMAVLANAHDRDPASHNRSINAGGGKCSNNFVIATPVIAEIVWPKKTALGCAKGASIAPYNNTAVAPYHQNQPVHPIKPEDPQLAKGGGVQMLRQC
jgi:hypothetical protein